jgi:hypothetical protein
MIRELMEIETMSAVIEALESEHCGYCGKSDDPELMCDTCFERL